jgi:hypothetical protein
MVEAQRRFRSEAFDVVLTCSILPCACNVGGKKIPGELSGRLECVVDVRIGIVQTVKELEVDLAEDANRDEVLANIETALSGDAVLWLTDKKGRKVGVPAAKIAWVEVGAPEKDRRVGFGAP